MFEIYKKLLAVNRSIASNHDLPEEIDLVDHLNHEIEEKESRITQISPDTLNLQNPDDLAQFIELTKLNAEILQAQLKIQKHQSPSHDGTPHQLDQEIRKAKQLFDSLDSELQKFCDVYDATRNQDGSDPIRGSKAFFEREQASIDLQLFQNQISLLATQALLHNASNEE